MKKFFAMALICLGIFSVNFSANAAVEKIDSGLNFQQMTTGDYYWARVVNCNEWISLREYPSTSARRLAKVPLGAIVKIYRGAGEHYGSPYNGFYQTYYNGQWGWCLQEYLRVGQHAGSQP